MKLYIKNIIGTVAFAFFCLTSSSCSNDEENDVEVLQGDYSAMVEISYTATGDDSELNPVLMTIFEDEDQSTQEDVDLNAEWTKTVTYSTLPATVGFIAEPSLHDDVSSGAEVSASFKGTCTVTLLCGDEIVDFQNVEIDETATYEQSDELSIVNDYVFSVSEEGITRIYDEDYISDDDLQDAEELPEEDQDAVKVTGNLYYLSSVSSAEDVDSLHDNLVVRFTSQNQWAGTELTYGDYLLLKGSEIDAVDETVLRTSIDNGCILILEEVDDFAAFDSFCEKYDIYSPLIEAPSDLDCSIFILADADVDLDTDPDENVTGLFFLVSPDNGEDGYLTDYWQGLVIDHAVTVLNDLFENTESNAVSTRATGDDMTDLSGATKVYIKLEQLLKKSDYRKEKKASNTQTNVYSVQYDIYNVFSIDEKRNYYYIHQEFMCNFKPCYKSVYSSKVKTNGCNTIAKVCEWYGDEVTLSTTPKTSGMTSHANSPASTSSSSTYTTSLEWTFNGSVGYKARKPKVTTDGVYLSKQSSYSKSDVNVTNNSKGTDIAWSYKLSQAWTNFKLTCTACTNMHEGSAAGRSSYNGGTDFLISFPESSSAPVLTGKFTVTLRSSCGKCGYICGERTTSSSSTFDIELPALSSTDFQ